MLFFTSNQGFGAEEPSPKIGIDAYTNQDSYGNGQAVLVLGMIQNYDPNIHKPNSISYTISDPAGEVMDTGETTIFPNGSFGFKVVVGGSQYELTGNYKLELNFNSAQRKIPFLYTGGTPEDSSDSTPPEILQPKNIRMFAEEPDALTMITFDVLALDDIDEFIRPTCKPQSGFLFGVGETIVKCTARDSAGNFADPVTFSVTLIPPVTSIPAWIKNVAMFWCENQIDDASFIEAIQYLIDNEIIIIPPTNETTEGSQEVPIWVKNNACWWSMGSITDKDFATGLQYLIKQGIIKV